MKTPTGRPSKIRRVSYGIRVAALVAVFAFVAVPFYRVHSGSLSTSVISPLRATNKTASAHIDKYVKPSSLGLLPVVPPVAASIATYDGATCTVPQSDFVLGETVCAKATGVPVTIFSWHVSWVDTVGFVRQTDTAIADDQATYTYTLPSTETSVVNGQTVDNRGTWRVNLTRFSGAIQQTARFTVHEAANPVSDVFVQKFQRDPNQPAQAGGNIAFVIVVGNQGPDPAAVVRLVDSVPAGSTLASFTQTSGPS